jgi:hypothetical protein
MSVLFESCTKAVTSPQSPQSGFELCPAYDGTKLRFDWNQNDFFVWQFPQEWLLESKANDGLTSQPPYIGTFAKYRSKMRIFNRVC